MSIYFFFHNDNPERENPDSLNNTLKFTSFQVLLNQIVLGPSVVAIVFAWNNIWQGKLSELPNKYQKDAIPTLITGKNLFLEICLAWQYGLIFHVVLVF